MHSSLREASLRERFKAAEALEGESTELETRIRPFEEQRDGPDFVVDRECTRVI